MLAFTGLRLVTALCGGWFSPPIYVLFFALHVRLHLISYLQIGRDAQMAQTPSSALIANKPRARLVPQRTRVALCWKMSQSASPMGTVMCSMKQTVF